MKISFLLKIKRYFFYLTALSILFFGYACGRVNEIPAYLSIQPFAVSVQPTHGTARQNLSDAMVFINEEYLGIFELPATFPVLSLGATRVRVYPVVRQNGLRSNPVINPMFTFDSMTINLRANITDTIRPRTAYSSTTQILYVEGFESTNHSMGYNYDKNTRLRFISTEGGYENKSGQIILTRADTNIVMQKASTNRFVLPSSYQNLFLEMDYKCDSDLGVGFVGFDPQTLTETALIKTYLYPRKTWNKVYVNITSEVKATRSSEIRFYVASRLSDTLSRGEVWIDNLKILVK
jgi:hypothetical protein